MAKQKRNWDKIRTQPTQENAKYRDVYEQQQLDRSHIEKPQTMTSRTILALVAGLAAAAFLWWLMAAVEMTGVMDNVNAGWKKTFFSKDGVNSPYQYVTLRDSVPRFEEDGVTPVLDENGEQVIDHPSVRYIWYSGTGLLTDVQDGTWPEYTGCDEAHIDEEGRVAYGPGPLGYDDDGNPILDEAYEAAQAEREAAAAAMEQKPQIKLYLGIVPEGGTLESLPGFLGKLDGYGYVFDKSAATAYLDMDGVFDVTKDEQLFEGFDHNSVIDISKYGFKPAENRFRYTRLNRGELVDTADSMFHDSFMDLRPTPPKLVVSLLGFSALFGILYMVMKKNLASQNVLTDTADINQHHNDQHIALPEEVQSLYDIFPDVGAHSSVMVSSMISHQMITNKGLKKVKLAKRADKDILDEDGDVEVYKGDILRDEHGEPITTEVPLIDTKFSEALFDSAKVPQDKEIRKYYDTPAIPYNPGDANLDKLKGYDTVDKLINGDWEFPVYEPQRPGGVYIVDTAPVNTMV